MRRVLALPFHEFHADELKVDALHFCLLASGDHLGDVVGPFLGSLDGHLGPADHKAQVQGQLWISGRDWCDIAVFWPGLPLFVKRAYRDEGYIADLAQAVTAFNAEVDMIVDRVRAYDRREAA